MAIIPPEIELSLRFTNKPVFRKQKRCREIKRDSRAIRQHLLAGYIAKRTKNAMGCAENCQRAPKALISRI
jgi:hypothetical protein